MKECVLNGEHDNTECLKRLPDLEKEFFSQTFQISSPSLKPGYFSFNNFADLNRIAVLIKMSIIVLRIENSRMYLVHNFPNKYRKPYLYIGLKKEKTTTPWQLFIICYGLSPEHLLVEQSLFPNTTLISSLASNDRPCENNQVVLNDIEQLLSLLCEKNSIKEGDVIVSLRFNCCLKKTGCFSKLYSSKNCSFALEHVFYENNLFSSKLTAIEEAVKNKKLKLVSTFLNASCIGLIGNNTSINVKKVNEIIRNIMHIQNRDKIRSENFSHIPLTVTHEEFLKAQEERNSKKKYRPKNITKICSCKLCSATTTFDTNMNLAGPEQLCKTKWLLRDLLNLLGFNSLEMLDIVEKLSELSVASFDIESRTVSLDMHNFANDVNIDNSNLQKSKDFFKGCAVEAIQKPCMLAYSDKLDEKIPTDNNNKLTFFECETDLEADIFSMFKSFWNYLEKRQKTLIEEKRKIAHPILKIIERLEAEHSDFCGQWSQRYGHLPELHLHRTKKYSDIQTLQTLFFKDANSSFKQTVFGQLKTELEKMIHQLNIFSFYG